jgi:phosphopantetheinyl transferase
MDAPDLLWRYATFRQLSDEGRARADECLTSDEREEGARFRDASRRAGWLWGRLVGKGLLAEHLGDPTLDPREIRISSRDARGRAVRPVVRSRDLPVSACLSISHSDESVLVALCGRPGIRVGVDLVSMRSLRPGFLRMWFTAGEQAWLRRAGRDQAPVLWAIKEAVYKAANEGEPFKPRRVEVLPGASGDYACAYLGEAVGACCRIRTMPLDPYMAAFVTMPAFRGVVREPTPSRSPS